ncbi:patatin-like phospholipase family protein [uncultured Bacteroides sp.]|uniref:patatin-like phospholipase family protein n=1 Tax=uncultured Bacteroides sp. TaxID=162156 RepID=UPI002613169A|nr:patatin-like phospholipase family protein [uncultured Bacteroides sp.]
MTMKRNHTGFALSGGFIKGIAHLGMMQAFYEYNIRPDIFSGTSAGAIASVFLADGKQPFEVMELFLCRSFTDLAKVRPDKAGIFKLDYFMDFMRSNLKTRNLEDLPIPVIVTATDLDHGKCVHFTRGEIGRRVAASCCQPVLFAPVKLKGIHYVDGGIFMNLPVSPIRNQCEKVIALSVYSMLDEKYSLNLVNVASRAFHFMFKANMEKEFAQADLVVSPQGLEQFSNREFNRAEEIFSIGYFETLKILDRIDIKEYNKIDYGKK